MKEKKTSKASKRKVTARQPFKSDTTSDVKLEATKDIVAARNSCDKAVGVRKALPFEKIKVRPLGWSILINIQIQLSLDIGI